MERQRPTYTPKKIEELATHPVKIDPEIQKLLDKVPGVSRIDIVDGKEIPIPRNELGLPKPDQKVWKRH